MENKERRVNVTKDGIAVLRVYKKQSTFKGATENDFWYSATRADGASVVCNFKCDIPTDSKAFEIYNIKGQAKREEVEVKGNKYVNYTYYISECDFKEIDAVDLEV